MRQKKHFPTCKKRTKKALNTAFVYFLAFLVMGVTTLIFFNSSLDNETDERKFNFTIKTLEKVILLIIANLVGWNEFFEMIDHIPRHKTPQKDTFLSSDQGQMSAWTPAPKTCLRHITEFMLKIIVTLLSIPFLLAAMYGLFTQGESLIASFGISTGVKNKILALIPSLVLGTRFVTIPVVHTMKNIWGGHFEYTALVTGAGEPVKTNLKIRVLIFLLYCGTHLAESFLLSESIDQDWLRIMSIVGLTTSRSIAHLDHTDALPNAFRQWRSQPCSHRLLTSLTGFFSGAAHASPGVLGAYHYWSTHIIFNILMTLSACIEFFTGGLEHLQHGARHYTKCLA